MIIFLIIAPCTAASGEQNSSVRSAADSLMLLANEYQYAVPKIDESSKDTGMNLSNSDTIFEKASIGSSLGMLANNGIASENYTVNSDPIYDLGLLLDGEKKIDSKDPIYSNWIEFSKGFIAPSINYGHSSSDTDRALQYLYEGTYSLDDSNKDRTVYTYSSSDTGKNLQYLYEGTYSLDNSDKNLFDYQYSQSDPGRTLQYIYENKDALRNDFNKDGPHSDTINDLRWLSTSKQELPETYSGKTAPTNANLDALLSNSSNALAAKLLDISPDTYKREAIRGVSLDGAQSSWLKEICSSNWHQ